MSPEQARGKPVDKRADIWAFGAVLYEILTGQRPFKGRDVSEVLGSVLRLDPDWDALPDDTPPHLNVFLKRCLEKEPRQRVHDIADVRLAMEGAFQPVIDATAVPDARVQLRIWQRPVATFSIVLIAIAITGLTVWTLARSNAVPARGGLRVSRLCYRQGTPSGQASGVQSLSRQTARTWSTRRIVTSTCGP